MVLNFSRIVCLNVTNDEKPEIKLVEQGPSFSMAIRRTSFASDELRKQTLKIPRTYFLF